ncbi:YtxH domain-containing protein [Clostridium neuense]|uniref:YtxH domain-containing protein n=1 Tax=Clostridium neuense TaxID=1728934 RepID=A0ABW8TCW9_9CLOT
MRFLRGMTAGAVIGAVAGMLIMPQLSWNTRRRFGRSGRIIRNTAEDLMDSMKSWNK